MAFTPGITSSTLAMLLTAYMAVSDPLVMKGVLHRDVLLPCLVTHNDVFSLDNLVINWQNSENDHVLHSFFYETDQPEYQEKEFEGRTQLFPEEFHNGNVSLLLKDFRASDAGNYTCHVTLHDMKGYAPQRVELQVQDDQPEEKDQGWFHVFVLVPVALNVLILVIMLCICRKQEKKHLTQEGVPFLEKNTLNEAIECYRRAIDKASKSCCTSVSFGEGDKDHCLARTLIIVKTKKLGTANANKKYYLMGQEEGHVQSEDLFTEETMKLTSRRMLLVGDAGIGKSCFSKELQKKWALGKELRFYKCVIYITFTELNAINKPTSLLEILGSKCNELSTVLVDLLNLERLLLILDGLDEFNHELNDSVSSSRSGIDVPLDVSILVSKIINRDLLRNTDVLVTSRVSSVCKLSKYFTSKFIMEGFTDNQIKQYYNTFTGDDRVAREVYEFIRRSQLFSLVSIPLLSAISCKVLVNSPKQGGDFKFDRNKLATCSRIFASHLQNVLKNIFMNGPFTIEDVESIINDLAKVSYDNLILGGQEINVFNFLRGSKMSELLSQYFPDLFFKENNAVELFKYRHASIRDMFAALYCVWTLKEGDEIKQCLDAWVFCKMAPENKPALLQKLTEDHKETFQNFVRFFMGFVTYRGVDSFLSDPPPLADNVKQSLQEWFQFWIKEGLTNTALLNLLHCIFELQNQSLTDAVSHCFEDVFLCNTPLNSLDIIALQYSLEDSKLNTLDLRLCELRDRGVEQLKTIIKKSKNVLISSNSLTEESGKIIREILQEPDCIVSSLSLGTNNLGQVGGAEVWRSLEKNSSLQVLYLYDNNLKDEDTEVMTQTLRNNSTLKELHLCGNTFQESGLKNIEELKTHRPDLKVVVSIAEDEEIFLHVEEKVHTLHESWKEYPQDWLMQIMKKVINDLHQTTRGHATPSEERVEKLKDDTSRLIEIITLGGSSTPG